MARPTPVQIVSVLWVLYILGALFLDRLEIAVRHTAEQSPFLAHAFASALFYLLMVSTSFLLWKEGRQRWREILLLLVSSAVALFLGQVAVNLLYPELNLPNLAAVRERKYHHINPPNGRFIQGVKGDAPMVIETNEDGFRSAYTRKSFRQKAVRVAILGDSFPFGLGVGKEDSLPDILEAMLGEELGLDAGVLNCGVISYSPFLESLVFEDIVSQYRPTHTILFFDPTDIGDDHRYLSEATFTRGRVVFEQRGESRFQYWGFVVESFVRPVFVRPFVFPWMTIAGWLGWVEDEKEKPSLYRTEAVIDGESVNNRFFIYRHPLEKTRPFFDQTYGYIEKIARQAESIGSQFAVFVIPRYHHWNPEECPENWEGPEYRIDEPYQFEYFKYFGEKAGEAPFPILDLLPAFQATDRFPLVFKNDPHWNADGHRFVAEQTLYFMREHYFD